MSIDNKEFNFSYSSAEIRIFFNFHLGVDKTTTTKVWIGNVAQIGGVIQTEIAPRYVFGRADPKAVSKGKRMISGSMVLEIVNKSLVEDIKNALGNVNQIGSFVEGQDTTLSGDTITNKPTVEMIYEDQMPLFDIEIVANKDDKAGEQSMRTITGVQLISKGSAVGMRNIDIQEKYDFLATDITPFKPTMVNGVKV